jgi:divinyl chlorophyllide a 8-vinyl-reductase
LASRSGIKKDAYLIDYQATLNCLTAGRAAGARHFVLLSAFCVKNPWLQFQQAKLKFEAALQEQTDMTYTIVRPTAFFKSVSGQLEVVQGGAPYVMFGNGEVTRCNPIAESELAQYLLESVTDESRKNKIINLGGPDEPLTMKMQGAMLFKATGMEPKYFYAPLWLFDVIINTLQFLADVTKSEALEDAAETGRIGKYYAVEDMLTTKPEEKFGKITLQDHYNRIAVEGQEYDPYTTMFARARVGKFGDPEGPEDELKRLSEQGKQSSNVNGDAEKANSLFFAQEKEPIAK